MSSAKFPRSSLLNTKLEIDYAKVSAVFTVMSHICNSILLEVTDPPSSDRVAHKKCCPVFILFFNVGKPEALLFLVCVSKAIYSV